MLLVVSPDIYVYCKLVYKDKSSRTFVILVAIINYAKATLFYIFATSSTSKMVQVISSSRSNLSSPFFFFFFIKAYKCIATFNIVIVSQ